MNKPSNVVKVAVVILMLVGVILSALIWWLQAYLLRWQRHNMAE
jgi:NitT/TauT family transport system permease protein